MATFAKKCFVQKPKIYKKKVLPQKNCEVSFTNFQKRRVPSKILFSRNFCFPDSSGETSSRDPLNSTVGLELKEHFKAFSGAAAAEVEQKLKFLN